MTNAEIEAFRQELLADPIARTTDAPHLCRRATANVRSAAKLAARDAARRLVEAARRLWVQSGRDGARAVNLALASR